MASAISVVVGLTRKDLMRPVQLLQQDHPRELVGQRPRAHRQAVVDPLQRRRSAGAPDDERDLRSLPAALLQEGAEGAAVVRLPVGGQQRDERPPRDPPREARASRTSTSSSCTYRASSLL